MISAAELREILDYDATTGLFFWKKKIASKVTVGTRAGCVSVDDYVRIRIKGVLYLGHRLAWLHFYGDVPEMLDHRNMNRSDNRITNLRPATKSTNAMNAASHRDSSSIHKGVSWAANKGKWHSSICKDGIRLSLGHFNSESEAALAYARASTMLHGEYGRAA